MVDVQSQADLAVAALRRRCAGAAGGGLDAAAVVDRASDEAGPSGVAPAPAAADDGKWRKKLRLRLAPEGTKTLVEVNYFILALSDIAGAESRPSPSTSTSTCTGPTSGSSARARTRSSGTVWARHRDHKLIEAKTEFENFPPTTRRASRTRRGTARS